MRRERKDPEDGLARYLTEREGQTGEKYVGIATDGAEFIAFFLRDGQAVEVGGCRTEPEKPRKPSPLPGPARSSRRSDRKACPAGDRVGRQKR